jgi:hypothetical protein
MAARTARTSRMRAALLLLVVACCITLAAAPAPKAKPKAPSAKRLIKSLPMAKRVPAPPPKLGKVRAARVRCVALPRLPGAAANVPRCICGGDLCTTHHVLAVAPQKQAAALPQVRKPSLPVRSRLPRLSFRPGQTGRVSARFPSRTVLRGRAVWAEGRGAGGAAAAAQSRPLGERGAGPPQRAARRHRRRQRPATVHRELRAGRRLPRGGDGGCGRFLHLQVQLACGRGGG